MNLYDRFKNFAVTAANVLGSPWMFLANVLLILGWLISGPFFGFSDQWQLAINTITNTVTYLVVFLIQNTQNRDARAVHLKLDELITSVAGARNRMVNLQDLTDQELAELEEEFAKIRERVRLGHIAPHAAIKGEPNP